MLKKIVIFLSVFIISFWLIIVNKELNVNFICNTFASSDFTSPWFTIDVNTITPWKNDLIVWWSVEKTVNNILWTTIQALMIPLWAIALLVMTIWAGYMIFYHWQDELLSKWKSIFNAWLIGLVIALSSYYIVSLVRFILYSWT
jgi:hypothetical protein